MEYTKFRCLETLAEIYPTIAQASTEIINLQAILNLPKGTEHFLTDIHGEYEAFAHVLKNGSGSVRRKINQVFGHTLSQKEQRALATLIYYPKEKMELVKKQEPGISGLPSVFTVLFLSSVPRGRFLPYAPALLPYILPP